jgi:hypothetical protein
LAILSAPPRSPDDDLVSFEPCHGVTPILRVALALAVVVALPLMPGPKSHPASQAVAHFKKLRQCSPRNPPQLLQAKSGRWIPGRIVGRIILDQGFQQVSLWISAAYGTRCGALNTTFTLSPGRPETPRLRQTRLPASVFRGFAIL